MKSHVLLPIAGVLVVLAAVYFAIPSGPSAPRGTHAQIAGPPALKANAKDLKSTVVTPHLEQKIVPGKNILWCGTFQLAWNELCDLIGAPVQMQPPSPMADILNKRTATKADIDDASYVAMAGRIDEGFQQRVRDELQRKFSGRASPELLRDLDEAVGWAAYAYLFRSLPFEVAFDRLHGNMDFKGKRVDSFGLPFWGSNRDLTMRRARQIAILDYRSGGERFNPSNEEFIVELRTQDKDDRLILARITPANTLAGTIGEVWKRVAAAQPAELQDGETLLVPVLDFDLTREYHELLGHLVSNEPVKTGLPIAIARHLVRFKLDEKGAVLKSEANFAPAGAGARQFIFDKPFLILLQREDARNPYFALWVDNPELLVSTKDGRRM